MPSDIGKYGGAAGNKDYTPFPDRGNGKLDTHTPPKQTVKGAKRPGQG